MKDKYINIVATATIAFLLIVGTITVVSAQEQEFDQQTADEFAGVINSNFQKYQLTYLRIQHYGMYIFLVMMDIQFISGLRVAQRLKCH